MTEEDRDIPISVGEVEVEIETIDEAPVEAQKEATGLAVPTQILPNTLVVLPLANALFPGADHADWPARNSMA